MSGTNTLVSLDDPPTTQAEISPFEKQVSKQSNTSRRSNISQSASHEAIPNDLWKLSKNQSKKLYNFSAMSHQSVHDHHADGEEDEEEEEDHGHGHAEKPQSILTAIASAIINFLLMFGLCCAYGLIMFEDDFNAQHRGLAVKMNLSTALICGLLLAFLSKVPVAIGGPDLNPVVFLGMFTATLAEEIAKDNNLSYPAKDGRRLEDDGWLRHLGSKSSKVEPFCTDDHLKYHMEDCLNYHNELRATTIFTVAVSSALLGSLFYILGRFKLTRYVTYVPTNIMEAFLSCVGYKVFKYALVFCNYEPKQFIPAACVGVPLYFMKALHIGNPAVVIPIVLGIPIVVFYAILYASGGDIDSARKDGWMFGELENADFWSTWKYSLNIGTGHGGFAEHISIKAWTATLADLPIMIVVCLLDCLLKLSSTESKLPVKADKDYEIQVYGLANLFTTLCGSSVGYMQLKFNVINYGVMGNVKDRRGGIIYSLLCGFFFFYTTDLFNYLPRFFLSTLLFFAGSGFVAENLWGSRKYLSVGEWGQIFVILGVFIFMKSLLAAVIVGGLLTGVSFIARYAKVPCIQGHPLRGGELVPIDRKDLVLQCSIRHISNHCLMVVRLKGFIFFASAQKMTAWVTGQIEKVHELPEYRRLNWLVFDCELLDGLDSSASKAIGKLAQVAKANHVQLVWTGMSATFRKQLETCDTITSSKDWFHTLDEAIQYTDNIILSRIIRIQQRWQSVHPMFALTQQLACDRSRYDPFTHVLVRDMHRFGCPWQFCGRLEVKAYETILWKPGMSGRDLFLVHTGRVGIFRSIPSENNSSEWQQPTATYAHGWFLNRQSILQRPTRDYGVALEDGELLFWNEFQWSKMVRDRPSMASAIMKAVLQQDVEDASMLDREKKMRSADVVADEMDGGGELGEFSSEGFVAESDEEQQAGAHEIRLHMQGVTIAQAFDDFGFFDPVPPGEEFVFPQLPEYVVEDINIAFMTYSENRQGQEPPVRLPKSKIFDALRYAGFYNVALREIPQESLTRAEFTKVCLRALLLPLKKSTERKLQTRFNEYRAKHPDPIEVDPTRKTVDRGHLSNVLEEVFKISSMPIDDVDGVANMWGTGLGQRIDSDTFVAVISRYLRVHMYDMCVLRGMRELLGQTTIRDGDMITPKMVATANPKLTPEEIEEMIWSADFAEDKGAGQSVDFGMIIAALRVPVEVQCSLPPAPRMTTTAFDSMKTLDTSEPVDGDPKRDWINNVVIDFRETLTHTWAPPEAIQEPVDDPGDRFSEEPKAPELIIPDTIPAKILLLLDFPESSRMANRISVLMGIMILVSVLTLFLEPLISPKTEPMTKAEEKVWLGFEAFFTALFTVEFLLTFSVCNALGTQTHLQFLKEPMRICDIIAVLPFYIDQTIDTDQEEFRLFRIARLMRLSRLVRLGRLAKKSATFAPIAMILVVIWGIYMKNGLKE